MELVERARSGDREAWAAIWDLYGPALHTYARRLLDDEHDAADAVADTFVTAAEHLSELRDPEALRAWLYAVCRRHVQRRWTARGRVRPVEDEQLAAAVDATEQAVTASGLDAAEATELLWACAEGLPPADRELLALVLAADLDSGDVAAVTGERPAAVYVRVSRLKDALGRSAGALLVARHHRDDCDELDALLAGWDGVYSGLWRKRVARHVDACQTCGTSRRAAAGALFSLAGPAPLLLLPGLRERCVEGAVSGSPDVVPVSFQEGWPEPAAWSPEPLRRRGAVRALAAAAVLALLGAGAVALAGTQGTPPVQAVAGTAGTEPSPGASPSAAAAPVASSPEPAAVPVAASPAAPTAPPVAAPSPPAPPGPPSVVPTPTPAPSPLPAGPTVRLSLDQSSISTSCGSPSTALATAQVSGAGARTVLRWDGTAPGSATFDGSGSATVGPYESVEQAGGTDTVTVTATVTDALGRVATATRQLAVVLAPC